jgi:hypothetical protein
MCAGAPLAMTILHPFATLAREGCCRDTEVKPIGAKASIHFLVEEGQIRAEAVVRHTHPGSGLGPEFTAILGEDRQRLSESMRRLREFGFVSRLRASNQNQQAPSQ